MLYYVRRVVSRVVNYSNRFKRHFACKKLYSSQSQVELPIITSSRYIAVFTCNKCQHRSCKSFSKQSYHHGSVYIRCDSCKSFHLISDQLGWFGDSKQNIQDILKERGKLDNVELGMSI